MDSINLTIDGKPVACAPGMSVLEAALEAGIYIPHLCYHPDLPPADNCRLCLVEIEGREGPVTSCTVPAENRMVITTTTEAVRQGRQEAIVKILGPHPPDCGTCIKYLNCELQSLKQYFSTDDLAIEHHGKLLPVNADNPLFVLDPNKCVLCGRCIRACRDLRGVGILDFRKSGQEEYAGTENNIPLADAGCRFCGACAEVCPTGAILDKEELTKGKSKKKALVPCRYTCPAEIDVPGYVRAIRDKDYVKAVEIIQQKAPFPAVLGHVCNRTCEAVCRRGYVNVPVSIRDLKRFAAEQSGVIPLEGPGEPTGKKIAIIGSGPAGLTAAFYLNKLGHSATVFEAMPEAGGMLRYGIPEYRLPVSVLDREIAAIEKTGVSIKTGQRIESLDSLLEDGFDAALVAVGTHRGQKLPVPGSDSPGVYDGIAFLRRVKSEERPETGQKVVVLGGGSVAFDCARTALRLGAGTIHVACLEPRDGMPAEEDEIIQAEEEGIILHPLRSSTRIITDNGRITGVEMKEVETLAFDEDGRVNIETREGSGHVIEADTVIFAIGQKPDIPQGFGLDLTGRGLVAIDPFTQETSRPGIFAAGDAVSGTASVIEAIASGRKMAATIDRYLGGFGSIDRKTPSPDVKTRLGKEEGFAGLERIGSPIAQAEERTAGFCLVETGFCEDDALAEAGRCLQCDLRTAIRPVKFWSDYS